MTNSMVDYAGYLGDELHPDYEELEREAWDDGSDIGCGDCPDDECTGHCMSCSYRSI